jgi:hypothetical protein
MDDRQTREYRRETVQVQVQVQVLYRYIAYIA